jgi:hypothetical protein
MQGLTGLLFFGGGLGLLASAAVWRGMARRRTTATVRGALRNPDPRLRQAAFVVAGQLGLSPYVDLLLEHTHRERDPATALALAEVVARNQWEPADDSRLVELRLWAQQRLAHQAAHQEFPPLAGSPDDPQPGPQPSPVEAFLPAPPGASGPWGSSPWAAPPTASPLDDADLSAPLRESRGGRGDYSNAEIAELERWIRTRLEGQRQSLGDRTSQDRKPRA